MKQSKYEIQALYELQKLKETNIQLLRDSCNGNCRTCIYNEKQNCEVTTIIDYNEYIEKYEKEIIKLYKQSRKEQKL